MAYYSIYDFDHPYSRHRSVFDRDYPDDWGLHDDRDHHDDFDMSPRDRFGDPYPDFDFGMHERFDAEEEEYLLSLEGGSDYQPRHSSRNVGLEDSKLMSAEERKLMRYNINHRDLRNVRLWRGRSMDRNKWKRHLGTRRDRKWHRDRDSERIVDHILDARWVLNEDRMLRLGRTHEPRTESDAVTCGLSDRMPEMGDLYIQ